MPPLTLAPVPKKPLPALPEGLFYDSSTQFYHLKMPLGNWVELRLPRIQAHLAQTYGLALKAPFGQVSEVDNIIYNVEQYRSVQWVANVGGYPEGLLPQGKLRILITEGPTFIKPVPGDWSMLKGILERMFGEKQLTYFYGWLKTSLLMFSAQTRMPGQALVLCGPPMAGKNLVTHLVQMLFGGRSAGKPYDYMMGKTHFNSDLIAAELLTIEDEACYTGLKERLVFGAKIKDYAANKLFRLHKKFAVGTTVSPLQRLIISLNDVQERVMVLPPVLGDIEDKLMLFKVERHDMPMPTDTPKAEKAFQTALEAQLPAFADFLLNQWAIPQNLVSPRMGVRHYHHPDILAMLEEANEETDLLDLVDDALFASPSFSGAWHGRAVDLEGLLVSSTNLQIQRQAKKLLHARNSCGRYLGRLADRKDGRVIRHPGHAGIHRWTINPPGPQQPELTVVKGIGGKVAKRKPKANAKSVKAAGKPRKQKTAA